MLLTSINIHFSSQNDKQTFISKAGFDYGFGLFKASVTLQNMVNTYHLRGNVVIEAFQKGGEPNLLGSILTKDPATGQYYAMSCSLSAMGDCLNAVNGILNYATDSFTHQFSVNPASPSNLQSFGPDWASLVPVQYILPNITPPQSLVTQDVTNARNELGNLLKEYQYYSGHLYNLENYYPVAIRIEDIQHINALIQRSEDNINYIVSPTPNTGATKCFTSPTTCVATLNDIVKQITPITSNDLAFISNYRYIVPVTYAYYGYNTQYMQYAFNGNNWQRLWNDGVTHDVEFFINQNLFSFKIERNDQTGCAIFSGTSNNGLSYTGTLMFNVAIIVGVACNIPSTYWKLNITLTLIQSPYWFPVYGT